MPNEDESISKQFERAFRKRGIEFTARRALPVRRAERPMASSSPSRTARRSTASCCSSPSAVGRRPPDSASRRSASRWTAASSSPTSASRRTSPASTPSATSCPACSSRTAASSRASSSPRRSRDCNPIVIEDVNIPKVTYSDPEVASIGLSEAKAVEKYGADAVAAYDYNLAGNGKSHIIGTSGSVKVVRVKDGPDRRRPHDRCARRRTHRRSAAGGELGGSPRRRRAAHPRAPDAEARPSARRSWHSPASRCTASDPR